MRIVKLLEIKDELQGHFRRQDLFPIIGSGFTKGCNTKYGKDKQVPSGHDMKLYMQEYLVSHGHEAPSGESFSKVARYYDRFVEADDFWRYFQMHFIGVKLTGGRRKFLDINWRFIYTLNLDDGIERNSQYTCKVLPNRELQVDALKDQACVFKLHGDAEELIKYKRDSNAILSFPDYVSSLTKNQSLLEKLSVDLSYSNSLFIGCSLSDELDLLSVAQQLKSASPKIQRSRYFVMEGKPSEYQIVDLEDHGIDTIIAVDDWEAFYEEIAALAKASNYVMENELKEFQNINCIDASEKDSLDYLLHGKYLLNKGRNLLCFPTFFIQRDIEEKILVDMSVSRIQIIHGARVSGKSYLLAGLLRQVRNRDTYYFDSRNQVDTPLLTYLLNLKRSVLLFDTNVLTLDAVKCLLKTDYDRLDEQKLNIVICINNSDREVLELIAYERKYRPVYTKMIQTYELNNTFTKAQGRGKDKRLGEVDVLNKKLRSEWRLPFDRNSTLLDNLLDLQTKLRDNGETIFDPPLDMDAINTNRICLLILLAQNEKVSSRELVQCGLMTESTYLLQDLKITVEEDYRSLLSINTIDSARYQIVCNAKVWLLGQLREIAKYNKFKKMVIEAFRRMVSAFLGNTKQFKRVERLVKFDKLNEIFPNSKRIIVEIYEELMPVLNESYQYYHQNAKCHLWGMSRKDYQIAELENARIAALTALSMVEEELDTCAFLPQQVAYAHVLNTLAIIYTKQCFMEKFQVSETVDEAVDYFYRAISCSENYEAMRETKLKKGREEYGGVLATWISYTLTHDVLMSARNKDKATRLFALWKDLPDW